MKLRDLIEQYGDYTVTQELIEMLEKPKPQSVWDLGGGDRHHWIDATGAVCMDFIWRGNEEDKLMREMGNIFLTQEEANKEVERRKVETLLLKYGGRRWVKEGSICNYYMWVNTRNLVVGCTGVGMQGLIYFDTREQAEKAIYEIGEERIKKALFEVKK